VAEDEQRKQSRTRAQEEAGGRWMSRSSEDSGATEPDTKRGCVSCRDFERDREYKMDFDQGNQDRYERLRSKEAFGVTIVFKAR
jgi:hypothetical protein